MAYTYTIQKLVDNPRRAVIKLTGTFDSSGLQQVNDLAVDVSSLNFAANSNGKLMLANTHPLSRYDVSINRIVGQIGLPSGYVQLNWHNASGNNIIATLGLGAVDMSLATLGDGSTIPNSNTTTSSGDIYISTVGATTNSAYTLILDLKKEGSHYIQAFPAA
jgi:hypothetical protein